MICDWYEDVGYMSRYGEAITERREVLGYRFQPALADASRELEKEDPDNFKAFSQQTLSRWENDRDGAKLEGSNAKALRTLAYLLEWTSEEFYERVGVPIGPVPQLDETMERRIFGFLERFGDRAELSVRIPVYGSVAAGIRGFEQGEHDEYRRFAPEELPKGVDPSKLYLVKSNGTSMYEEGMSRPVPDGAWLLVEHDALPEEGQLVVAYIPERDIGVVKQFRKGAGDAVLRSYRVGGPMFWASEYPDMRLEGVVRRVSYEP